MFMMTVWAKVLQTETGRAAVREFAKTHVANWTQIKDRKQASVNRSNLRENAKRKDHEYRKGDLVLMRYTLSLHDALPISAGQPRP